MWRILYMGNFQRPRHSSEGWNPVHRNFKHLGGLGPSLRWDDGLFEVFAGETLALASLSGRKCLKHRAGASCGN